MEGSVSGPIEEISLHVLKRLMKTMKTSVRSAGVPGLIRTEYLPNTSIGRYR
jgi:hypothetical protein